MAAKNLERILRDNGFGLKRNGKHSIWSDGVSDIALHLGSKDRPFAEARLRSQLRRALEKRPKGGVNAKAK